MPQLQVQFSVLSGMQQSLCCGSECVTSIVAALLSKSRLASLIEPVHLIVLKFLLLLYSCSLLYAY